MGNSKTTEHSAASGTDLTEHFDVLIVGAGISGIGGAYHLQAVSYTHLTLPTILLV